MKMRGHRAIGILICSVFIAQTDQIQRSEPRREIRIAKCVDANKRNSNIMKGLIGLILFLTALTTVNAQPLGPNIGDVAPDLNLIKTLQASDPGAANLNSLKGNVVVLEFWATWCGPCIPALKHFSRLSETFKGKPVRFIAVTD